MTQPVTVLSSFALAPQLEELSALASRITHHSDELRATLQSGSLANTANACALLHVALSNAQGCLSLLQSINQAPINPSYVDHPQTAAFTEFSRSVPSSSKPSILGLRSPTTLVATDISPLPHPAYPPKGMTGTRLPDTPLDLSSPLHPHPNMSATQMWPVPSTSSPHIHPAPGGHSTNGYSPDPLPLHQTTTRRGVTIGELVDEEDLFPDTRGGVNPFRPPAWDMPPRAAINYPPLSIVIIDVTPRPTGGPETTQASADAPLKPSSQGPSTPTPHQGRAAHQGGKAPRSRGRKTVPQVAPEVPEKRVTRSGIKRGAPTEFGTSQTGFSKRPKTSST